MSLVLARDYESSMLCKPRLFAVESHVLCSCPGEGIGPKAHGSLVATVETLLAVYPGSLPSIGAVLKYMWAGELSDDAGSRTLDH